MTLFLLSARRTIPQLRDQQKNRPGRPFRQLEHQQSRRLAAHPRKNPLHEGPCDPPTELSNAPEDPIAPQDPTAPRLPKINHQDRIWRLLEKPSPRKVGIEEQRVDPHSLQTQLQPPQTWASSRATTCIWKSRDTPLMTARERKQGVCRVRASTNASRWAEISKSANAT